MNRYRVSDEARKDLHEIWLYIAEDNPSVADKFIHTLVSRFPILASSPETGRQRKDFPGNLRSHVVGNYVIFYRRMDGEIEIARVVHGARDLPPLFS